MSSINPHFTFNYQQPKDYRFSHDSVFLARRVFEEYADKETSSLRGLDLCAGCGIIGLDFLFHLNKEKNKALASFDFLEIQDVYAPFFAANAQHLSTTRTSLHFVQMNYAALLQPNKENSYDLIVCNPPYFHLQQGKLSPSEFKNRCRFFIDSDFATLFKGLENALKPQGQAYVLVRNQTEHGWDALQEAQKILSSQVKCTVLDDVRGTDLLRITKSSAPPQL
ncbi:MAG: methyltransferase [Bdellovibrio sp.]|nr:methyltransferase [Bdellovibrio sp.]